MKAAYHRAQAREIKTHKAVKKVNPKNKKNNNRTRKNLNNKRKSNQAMTDDLKDDLIPD